MARKDLIQHRRDTAANWTSVNPVLAASELGFETDTNKFKLGDGISTWTALAYQGGGGSGVSLTPSTTQTIVAQNTATKPLVVQGAASTTVNLFEIRDGSGALQFNAYPSGALYSNLGIYGYVFYEYQGPPITNSSTSYAILPADCFKKIIVSTTTTATTATLPTASTFETEFIAQFGQTPPNPIAFDWHIINTGTVTGAVTVAANTGHTFVGNAVVAINTTGRFRTRRQSSSTYVTYRLS